MVDKNNKAGMLEGASAIARHANRDISAIVDWQQNWIGCPIKRKDNVLVCSIKELDKWMTERGLKKPKQKKF